MKSLLLLLVICCFYSCSPQQEITKTKISLGAISQSDLFPGGLYIIAHNPQTQIGMIKRVFSAELDLELANGEWEFGAMGWEGTSAMDGNLKCFMSQPQKLTGAEVTVQLTLSDQGCTNDLFTPEKFSSGSPLKPKPLQVVSCSLLDKLNPNSFSEDETCENSIGSAKSFKVVLYDIALANTDKLDAVKSNPFQSKCVVLDNINHNTLAANSIIVPAFDGIPMGVETYSTPDCSGDKTYYHYPKGLGEQSSQLTSNGAITTQTSFVQSSQNFTKVFIQNNLCEDTNYLSFNTLGQMNGIGLDGAARPYILCNETQFGLIQSLASANYTLGQDIDFNSDADNNISTVFNGQLEGNSFKLMNYHYTGTLTQAGGLFSMLSDGAKIKNLTISNFIITTTGNFPSGLLVGNINSAGSNMVEVSNIQITDSSQIETDLGSIGALIGKIYLSSGIEKILIQNNSSNAQVSSLGANTNSIGGLVGKVENLSSSSQIDFILNQVNNAQIETHTSSINSSTGGLVGSSYKVNYLKNDYIASTATIKAPKNVGGLIGLSQSDIVTESIIEANLVINSDGYTNYGGAIGKINISVDNEVSLLTESYIKSNISAESGSTSSHQIGGAVGSVELSATSTCSALLKNNKIETLIHSNGYDHGGLVGFENITNAANIANYSHNLIYAQIQEANLLSSNGFKGGLIGTSAGSYIKRNIINAFVEGTAHLGGIVGHAKNLNQASRIEENYVHSLIQSRRNGTGEYIVGGAVGFLEDGVILKHTKIDGYIFLDEVDDCNGDATKDYCAKVVGKNFNATAANLSDIVANNSIYVDTIDDNNFSSVDDTSLSPTIYLNVNTINGTHYQRFYPDDSVLTITAHSSLGSGPWDGIWNGSNKTHLSFYMNFYNLAKIPYTLDLDQDGIDETQDFMAGNRVDPIYLATKDDWNQIADNPYLLTKSYALANDISFLSLPSEFIPLGGKGALTDQKKFTGSLISNSFRLKDISIDTSEFPDNSTIGVVRMLGFGDGPGKLGTEYAPLEIENLSIHITSTQDKIGGLVGGIENGDVHAKISQGSIINDNMANMIGGLIGATLYDSKAKITHSHFLGEVMSNTASSITAGGLVGSVLGGSMTEIELHNNVVNLHKLTSPQPSSLLGGFVGDFNGGTTSSKSSIRSNLVRFDYMSELSSSANSAGFIASYLESPNKSIRSNLVDLAQLTSTLAPANYFINTSLFADGNNGELTNYVIAGSASPSVTTDMVQASYATAYDLAIDPSALFMPGSQHNFFYATNGTEDILTDDFIDLY